MAVAEFIIPKQTEKAFHRAHLEQSSFVERMNSEQRRLFAEAGKVYVEAHQNYSPRRFWNFRFSIRELQSRIVNVLV